MDKNTLIDRWTKQTNGEFGFFAEYWIHQVSAIPRWVDVTPFRNRLFSGLNTLMAQASDQPELLGFQTPDEITELWEHFSNCLSEVLRKEDAADIDY